MNDYEKGQRDGFQRALRWAIWRTLANATQSKEDVARREEIVAVFRKALNADEAVAGSSPEAEPELPMFKEPSR